MSQPGKSFSGFIVVDADGQGFTGADQHHQAAAPGDGGVDQVALQEHVVLDQDRHHHGRVF